MIKHRYGHFSDKQFSCFISKLHKKLFWLLLYKDPKTKDLYPDIDFDKYFKGVMTRIEGLNSLLDYPAEIVFLLCNLEAAYLESLKDDFQYEDYRALILRSHSLLDKICEETDA